MARITVLILMVVLATGCSDPGPGYPVEDPPDPPLEVPFAGSPDQLMANFRTIYEKRSVERYLDLMHPDFRLFLQQATIRAYPELGNYLDRAEEDRVAWRMFSGEDVVDPDDQFVPRILGISFNRFVPREDWTLSPPEDLIPETLSAPYEVDLLIDRGQDQISVKGVIRFYATSRDSVHQGVTRPYYRMVGQVDLTAQSKATDEKTWGELKAIYR